MTKLAEGPDPTIFTDAVTHAVEAVLYTDIDETITYVNPAFTTITGYAPAEALGRTPRFLNSGEHSPEFFKNMWDQLRANHMWKGRIRNRHTDGSVYIAETTITAVMNAQGNLRGYLSIALDVSQEAQLQEREATHQKLEALGTLAGGIAHDLNNILNATANARELTDRILTFSRGKTAARTAVDLTVVVPDAVCLLEAAVSRTIRIETSVLGPVPPVLTRTGLGWGFRWSTGSSPTTADRSISQAKWATAPALW